MTALDSPVTVSLGSFPQTQTQARSHTSRPGLQTCELPDEFTLTHDLQPQPLRLAFEDTGGDGPTVVVLGGISATAHVTATSENPSPGWWHTLVGPGKAIDTRTFRVLSFDYLGGNGGSSGPRTTCEPASFPAVTTEDQARALACLLDLLEIPHLHSIVGASYGGMVALAFGALFQNRPQHLAVISAADRSHPMATAWRSLQRRVVRLSLEHGCESEGLALSRGLAMTTYRCRDEFADRFTGPPRRSGTSFRFPVESYLESRGRDFSERFDAYAFLRLSESLDLHRVDPRQVTANTTLIAASSDQLVTLPEMETLSRRLAGPCNFHTLETRYGHDTFLKETSLLTDILQPALERTEAIS